MQSGFIPMPMGLRGKLVVHLGLTPSQLQRAPELLTAVNRSGPPCFPHEGNYAVTARPSPCAQRFTREARSIFHYVYFIFLN